jgi:hypothetical protein
MKFFLTILAVGLAWGDTITLQSGVSAGESNNQTGANYVLPVLTPVWAPDHGGAEWISFENTGWDPSTNGAVITLPNVGPGETSAIFYQTFTDDAGTALDGSITVWADDTASVYLDGVLLVAANYGQAANCSPGPITCTGPGYVVDFTTSPGTHTLQFDVSQTGGVTFGLMYYGPITSVETATAPVPEPGSIWLLAGVGGIVAVLLKKKVPVPVPSCGTGTAGGVV